MGGGLDRVVTEGGEALAHPMDGGTEFGLFDFIQVFKHDVEIAEGAELAAEGSADAIEWAAASAGDNRFDEIGGGFQSAGDDAGIVDGIDIFAGNGGGHEVAEVLDHGVEIL
jgi:hypothetical protein